MPRWERACVRRTPCHWKGEQRNLSQRWDICVGALERALEGRTDLAALIDVAAAEMEPIAVVQNKVRRAKALGDPCRRAFSTLVGSMGGR